MYEAAEGDGSDLGNELVKSQNERDRRYKRHTISMSNENFQNDSGIHLDGP